VLYDSNPRESVPIGCIYIGRINLPSYYTLAYLDYLSFLPDGNERYPVFLGCLDPSRVRSDGGKVLWLEVFSISLECVLQWGAVSEVVGPGINQ
jgi:hypothetical protein